MAKNPSLPVLTLLLGIVSIMLYGCSARSAVQRKDLNSVAESYLGKNYKVEYNASQTLALCQQIPAGDHVGRKYKYIVIRSTDNHVVRSETFRSGYVKWLDDHSLEVYSANETSSDSGPTDKKILKVNPTDNR
jgi:hypothetical protein